MVEKVPVLKPFRDAQDNKHAYGQNGLYPRKGYEPSHDRYEELAEKGYIGKRKEKEKMTEKNTKDEIQAVLDKEGIAWSESDTKKELLALLDDGNDSK